MYQEKCMKNENGWQKLDIFFSLNNKTKQSSIKRIFRRLSLIMKHALRLHYFMLYPLRNIIHVKFTKNIHLRIKTTWKIENLTFAKLNPQRELIYLSYCSSRYVFLLLGVSNPGRASAAFSLPPGTNFKFKKHFYVDCRFS